MAVVLRNLARDGKMDLRMNATPAPLPRRAGILQRRRQRNEWPSGRPFHILSLDGGGIKGIFTAAILAGMERQYLDGAPVADYFDLVVGTSTGGIIALGLAAGVPAADLLSLYLNQGGEIFPPRFRVMRKIRQYFHAAYKRRPLDSILAGVLGDRQLRDASCRLCIPSLDGRHGDVYVFKTPHHSDYKRDGDELMTKVAAATSAAPTFFKPLRRDGYIFADGGVWANNPIMIGLVEALSAFSTRREDISILSIGCGDTPYTIQRWQVALGGAISWWNVIFAAMHFQSQNAIGQAGLLIGRDNIIRIEPSETSSRIGLDDWRKASGKLPGEAEQALSIYGESIADTFLASKALSYLPLA